MLILLLQTCSESLTDFLCLQGVCLVTLRDRDREATWIVASGAALSLGVDTVCLAVALLDRILVATRVPVK